MFTHTEAHNSCSNPSNYFFGTLHFFKDIIMINIDKYKVKSRILHFFFSINKLNSDWYSFQFVNNSTNMRENLLIKIV